MATKNRFSLFPLTPERMYFIGFFAADGNITINKNGSHYVEITSKDIDLLASFKRHFQLPVKISERIESNGSNLRYRIQVGSKSLVLELLKLGFSPRKSKTLKIPKIPEPFFAPFVRGYFDGDGNVMFKYYKRKGRSRFSPFFRVVFTSCSGNFLRQMLAKLRELNVVKKGTVFKESNYNRLVLAPKDSLSLGKFMYNSHRSKATPFVLGRKQRIFAAARTFYRERTEQKPKGFLNV
jgi:intein-encoded DNA endonuclease-like protein